MRSLADRQQRAFAATRWRRDAARGSLSIPTQRRAAKLLRASPRAEAGYVRDVVACMRAVHAGFLKSLGTPAASAAAESPELRANGGEGARYDGAKPFPKGMEARLFKFIEARVGPAFDRMGQGVNKDNREGLALLGIQPAMVPGLGDAIHDARAKNIALVQEAAGTYAAQVRGVLEDPKNLGLRVEELRDLLEERGSVSRSRAEFIARDQTLRLNAAIGRKRQEAAGVTSYRWSTSRDERVRPLHEVLEGEKFAFDDPPVTNDEGDQNNPGEDYQCRCVPLPVIPELEGEEEPEEPGEEAEEEEKPEEKPEEPEAEEPPEREPPAPEVEEPAVAGDVGSLGAEHFSRVRRDVAAAMTVDEVLDTPLMKGLARWLEAAPEKPLLTITSENVAGGRAEGMWDPTSGKVRISINANVRPPDNPGGWGSVWRVADRMAPLRSASEATSAAKVRDSLTHEIGHHVHAAAVRTLPSDVRALVEDTYKRHFGEPSFLKAVFEKRITSPAISWYASQDPAEYFAETFNAYQAEPAALQHHDPTGFSMVREVLRRLKIAP